MRRLLAVSPGASLASTRAMFGKLVERNPRGFERYFEGLRRCGLREDERLEGGRRSPRTGKDQGR